MVNSPIIKNMKILHVITSLHVGGAETLVVNLMPHFINLGYEVGIVVFNGEETPLTKKLQNDCPNCKLYKLGYSYYNPFYIIKLIWIMRKYDIIHTHNSSPQLFCVISNIFCKKKLITTEHSTNNRKREQGGVLRLMDKWMYNHYNSIICISEIATHELLKYLGKDNSHCICTINNGVDVGAINRSMPLTRKNNKFIILMVAGFREAKDQDTIVKAMQKLPKEKYEIWFVGEGTRKHDVEKLVKKVGVKDNVVFWGLRSDVNSFLKSADVIVMSSHWEGLSLSNIEGMSAGKPFIASDVKGLHEVTNGYGILFPHEDADSLATIIKKLHDDEQYYQKVASKCYERAQQFDISKTVKAYSEVYKSLV